MPESPGALALLAAFPASEAAGDKLARALASSQPEVRAAAARVALVTARRALLPHTIALLESESSPEVLLEASRLVASLGTPEHADLVLAAWERLPVDQVLLTVASARGPQFLAQLPRLRRHAVGEELLAQVLRAATRETPDELLRVAEQAVRDQDRMLFAAALLARDVRAAPPSGAIMRALDPQSDPRMRLTALRHLLRVWSLETSSFTTEIAARVGEALDAAAPEPRAEELFAYELAARALKRPARTDAAWTAFLRQRKPDLLDYFAFTSTRGLLTETERRILVKTYDLDSRALPEAFPATALPPSTDRGGPVFTASGYPRGFMSSVFATTGCKLSKSNNVDVDPGAANVVLRRDGGLSQAGLIDTGTPESCATAIRTLLLTYVSPVERVFRDGDTALLMIPLTADYVQCHEANGSVPGAQAPARPFADSRMIPVPKKTRDIKPRYPVSMQSRGVSGIVILESVISTTGCVQHARVLRSVQPGLDWAAMRAVLDWRFAPTKIDGVPTPMALSVTVNFVIN